MKKPIVIVILGQTATGKSKVAIEIAKRIHGEIISADSRQVYKGLDIGTAKITLKEMQGIKHYLLDVANPKRKFTVWQYKRMVEDKIAEIIVRNKVPIICGGTGFYIDAITKGLIFPEVPPNYALRRKLNKKTSQWLYNELMKLDPKRAGNMDPKNMVRLIRAIEIVKSLGQVPKIKTKKPLYKFIKIGLYLPGDVMRKKIEQRVKKMFSLGLLSEIRKLKSAGISDRRLQELGFEYFEPDREKVIRQTLKYARRQMTWFKRDKKIKWFNAVNSPTKNTLTYLHEVI